MFPIKKKLNDKQIQINEQINHLLLLNKNLKNVNVLLEQRIQKLERAVSKLLYESKSVKSKHGFLKEHVRTLQNQLSIITTRKIHK